MAKKGVARRGRLYVGVDVGGTKILALLVEESGCILARQRHATPRGGKPARTLVAIEAAVGGLLMEQGLAPKDLAGIGVAAAGVVDPDSGLVVFTPNMNLSGVPLAKQLESRFGVPVALGNDCNLGTLGEKWLGSARSAHSAFGMFVGTGIGGGYVRKGKLLRGHRETAAEVGHIVMQVGGPKCGCGNRGCFEALASRTAIERDIRQAVGAGRKTALTGLLGGDLSMIRSGALRRALEKKDRLITKVLRRAAEYIGCGCLTVRHLLDPEVIVLGGGVLEACGDFMMPIIEAVLSADGLRGAREGGRVLLAALGDDAVALGAVALARDHVGRSPFRKACHVLPAYLPIHLAKSGQVTIGDKTYAKDVCVRVNGKVKKVKKLKGPGDEAAGAGRAGKGARCIGPKEVVDACEGGPEVVFIGTGPSGKVRVAPEAREFLRVRAIDCQILATPAAVKAYNRTRRRKAALLCVAP